MIYPKKLSKIKTIGIFAPSSGIGDYLERFELVKKVFENRGYRLKITDSVTNVGLVSNTSENRIKEFESLLKDEEVDVIFCASGGEFALELAPLIDFKLIKMHPKYIVGFSDSTIITYLSTINADVSTITSYNFLNISRVLKHESFENLLKIIDNQDIKQRKYELYEKEKKTDYVSLDTKNKYKSNQRKVNISGRIIGGTIECISEILGMPYDNTSKFIQEYEKDGFIWYFDVCEMNSTEFYRVLLRMNHLGYFKNIKAVLMGRRPNNCEETDISYSEAITKIFSNIPIIEDVDIGHTYPQLTIINGSVAYIEYCNGSFSIKFKKE